MKRWIALGMVALMVIGFGALAWGQATAEVTIACNCTIDPFGFGNPTVWVGDAGNPVGSSPTAPGDKGTYYATASVAGNANASGTVTVSISGPLTESVSGDTLITSLLVNNPGGDATGTGTSIVPSTEIKPVPAGGASIVVTTVHSSGAFSFDIVVDITRAGYADHYGTYSATVSVVCNICSTP